MLEIRSLLMTHIGRKSTGNTDVNPLTPRRILVAPFTKILFSEGIIKKISNERRAYESVDEKSLS